MTTDSEMLRRTRHRMAKRSLIGFNNPRSPSVRVTTQSRSPDEPGWKRELQHKRSKKVTLAKLRNDLDP